MASFDRKEMILDYMRNNNRFVTVQQLCDNLFVSGATVRRDLSELESSRLIRRTRGGAVLIEGTNNEDPLDFRENQNVMQKQIIAGIACSHIKDGMTLFLDSSSTIYYLGRQLNQFNNLTVVTNGLKTALHLSDYKNINVSCTGGNLRENSKALVGHSTMEYISRLNADIAFMSCRGFTFENGASEANEDEFYIKRQFIANSKQSILLCDSSKMDLDFICRIAPLSRFSAIITERKDINDLIRSQVSGS